MRRALTSLRLIGPCLVAAGFTQFIVCHIHPGDYPERMFWFFTSGWAICSLLLAWFEQRLFFVYFGSVALAAPVISYSMLEYGALEMGGWFHAFAAGIFSLHSIFYSVVFASGRRGQRQEERHDFIA